MLIGWRWNEVIQGPTESLRRAFGIACAPLALAFSVPGIALSQSAAVSAGDLRIEQAWARPLPAVSKNGAVYMTLINGGTAAYSLTTAQSNCRYDSLFFHPRSPWLYICLTCRVMLNQGDRSQTGKCQ